MLIKRIKCHKVGVAGASHSVYVSHPKQAAALIAHPAHRAVLLRQIRAVAKVYRWERVGEVCASLHRYSEFYPAQDVGRRTPNSKILHSWSL
jgi:hypothetical protein